MEVLVEGLLKYVMTFGYHWALKGFKVFWKVLQNQKCSACFVLLKNCCEIFRKFLENHFTTGYILKANSYAEY